MNKKELQELKAAVKKVVRDSQGKPAAKKKILVGTGMYTTKGTLKKAFR